MWSSGKKVLTLIIKKNNKHIDFNGKFIDWMKRRTKTWKRNKCYISFCYEYLNAVRADNEKKKRTQIDWTYMKKQFCSVAHTWNMHKAQSHQVEFNWLQLFNFFFSFSVSISPARFFQCLHSVHGPFFEVNFCVLVYERILQFVLFLLFFSQLEHFNGNPSCKLNDQPNNQRAKNWRKKTVEAKIFQFPLQLLHKSSNIWRMCSVFVLLFFSFLDFKWCVCEKEKKHCEPKYPKQTSKTSTERTIMEQVNGGSSNTETHKDEFIFLRRMKFQWISLMFLFFLLFFAFTFFSSLELFFTTSCHCCYCCFFSLSLGLT